MIQLYLMNDTDESQAQPHHPRPWLLLIHQIPAEPAYLRVKVSRRLRGLGALAVKNSVYALPDTAAAREDLAWVRREIVAGGGEALLTAVGFIAGMTEAELEAQMRAERQAEYTELAGEARGLDGPTRAEVQRLRRRLEEVVERDHVDAPGRAAAEHAIGQVEARLRGEAGSGVEAAGAPEGAVWVTRRGVHVDRTASGWLIRRFIDTAATFRFVEPDGYVAAGGEIPFDMFEGGYTHEGDRCTFETLMAAFDREKDAALRAIGEVVHDIDCREARYGRPETAGVAGLIRGITFAHDDDAARIEAASHVWDALYAHFAVAV